MTIFLCSLVGAAMLTCAGIVGYCIRARQERVPTKREPTKTTITNDASVN